MKRIFIATMITATLVAACGDSPPPSATTPPPQVASAPPAAVMNMPAVIRQPPDVVTLLLGKPLGCETTQKGEKCQYSDKTEVVFIDNLSDWITVNADLPFGPDALPLMGFKPAQPSFQNENTMRWSGEQDTLSISLTPGAAGRAAYAYIKVTSQ